MTSSHRWDPVAPRPAGLVRPCPFDSTGRAGPTRGQARGPRWRITTPGLAVPATVSDELPEQRILEQSMRLPADGAVTGWAACRLWRAAFFDGLAGDGRTRVPVPLALGGVSQIRARPGTVLLRDRLPAHEVAVVAGIRVTRRRRALFDAMRTAPDVREATVAMDMMAAARQVSIRQMRDYVAHRPGWRGVEQARRALDLASEHSRSPQETRTRLVWVLDAGLPPPLVNCEVFTRDGRLLGVADLLDPVAGVVGEFDGADHRGAVTGIDLHHPARVAERMLATRARARWEPPDARAWTIEPPPRWPLSLPLDDELALRALDEQAPGELPTRRPA